MATGSVLRCQNFPNFFEPKPPTVHTFHSSSSQCPSADTVLVLGQDLFRFYHTCQISEGLRKHVSSSKATQIICNKELMLKKGFAWYYSHYDKRTELKNQAGLWASPTPEEPWEWRKNQRNNAACAAISHRRDRKSPRNVPPRLQKIPNS